MDEEQLRDAALAAVNTLTDGGARYVLGVLTFDVPEAVLAAVELAARHEPNAIKS